MSAKVVFASQVLAVYITGEELLKWFGDGMVMADIYVGKTKVGASSVCRSTDPLVWPTVIAAWRKERIAIDTARSKMLPRSDTRSADRQRRKVESRD